jgi:serine/threonine-protein kinase
VAVAKPRGFPRFVASIGLAFAGLFGILILMKGMREQSRAGEVVNGAYSLDMLQRAEGPCEFYLATEQKNGLPVTVKLLKPEYALNQAVAEAFLQTPRALQPIKHPNLPEILGIETDDTGIPFVVEEHVEGMPLSNELERFGRGMPLGPALDLVLQILSAVGMAHERGVVHGRLSPRSVVLERREDKKIVRVLDFCGASLAVALGTGAKGGAAADYLAPYLSPEARADPKRIDPRSDVWSLGVMIFEVFTGQLPYPTDDKGELDLGRMRSLEEVSQEVPPHLRATVNACLSKAPGSRPPNAGDLRERLLEPPPRSSKPPQTWPGRKSKRPDAMRTSSPGRLSVDSVDPMAATVSADSGPHRIPPGKGNR